MKNEKKKKVLKDERLVMRMTSVDDDKLHSLTEYLCKSRSDVMRDALNLLYQSEGGDDIRNKPPKECNTHLRLSNSDLEKLNNMSREYGESKSDVVKKAIDFYQNHKGRT